MRWRPCRASCVSPAGAAGSSPIRSNSWSPTSDRGGRVLGREEVARLLECCPPAGRLQVETAHYTGLRISELLGLVWADVDFAAGLLRVRSRLSRAHRQEPAGRVTPKTPASEVSETKADVRADR